MRVSASLHLIGGRGLHNGLYIGKNRKRWLLRHKGGRILSIEKEKNEQREALQRKVKI